MVNETFDRSENQPGVLRVFQTRKEIKSFYDRISRFYDLLTYRSEEPIRRAALKALNVLPGEKVLKIGFGTGHCLIALARAAGPTGKVYGNDLSGEMLIIAQGKMEKEGLNKQAELSHVDATRLPHPPDTMDAILMSFVLELFDTPEIPQVLAECKRVLRPGGRIVIASLSKEGKGSIILCAFEWLHQHFPVFMNCRAIFVRKALEAAGFRIDCISKRKMWGQVEIALAVKEEGITPSG